MRGGAPGEAARRRSRGSLGRGGLGRPVGPEDPVAAGQALQLELAAVVEAEAIAVAGRGRIAHLLRDEDLAAHRLGRNPRGEDHVLAEVVALLRDHLAGVQADANAKGLTAAVALALRKGAL